jgi:transitional endoplasmic reticulum ATPase
MENRNTVGKLVEEIGVSRPDLVRFGLCYNIDLKSFCKIQQHYFGSYLEIYDHGYKFLLQRSEKITEFRDDYFKTKKVKELCDKLGMNLTEFVKFYNQYKETISNHGYTLSPVFKPDMKKITEESTMLYISTFLLENLKNGFPKKITNGIENSVVTLDDDSDLEFNNIIGYDDFKVSVKDLLIPIIDSKSLDIWGLRKPGGILLFGPPGCGKTFWAEQIALYLKFQFMEVPRSQFASSLVDGAVINLKEILDNVQPKTVLFFDEFDSVAETRSNSTSGSKENIKIVNTLLQEIPKLIKKEVVIIAATNHLSRIDSAVIRPGRFDLKIPIFPPNQKERAKIIYYKLKSNLNSKSPLIEILKNSSIKSYDFFNKYAANMQLFSSSLLEDFVDTLKRSLKYSYDSNWELNKILIDDDRVYEIIEKTKAKIISQDLEFLANFYLEVETLSGSSLYIERLKVLKSDLEGSFIGQEDPPKPIGYRMPNTDK